MKRKYGQSKAAGADPVPIEEQQRLERLLRKHRKRLLSLPNVHLVDIGFEYTNGKETGRLALRVHAARTPSARGPARARRWAHHCRQS